jgi:hypothetical protein
MAETDADLIDRMAKRHSVSPAAVQVVMAALRSGGGRMAQFSHADFGGMFTMVAGHVNGRRYVQYAAKGQARRALQRHCSAFGLVHRRRQPICWGRGQLPFNVGIGGLVAGRTGEAGCSGCPERSSIRGFRGHAPIGDRRPGRRLGLRHRRSSDFRRRPGPKQRPNALVHEPGWTCQGCGPSKGCRLIGQGHASSHRNVDRAIRQCAERQQTIKMPRYATILYRFD